MYITGRSKAVLLIWFSVFSYSRVSFCAVYLLCMWIISSPEPRLIGELIGYSWSGVRPASSSFTMLKDLLLRTALPIKAKFYVEPPCVGGTIFCSRHQGHMTKIAAMVKTLQKSSSLEPAGRFSRNLVCSIGDSSP